MYKLHSCKGFVEMVGEGLEAATMRARRLRHKEESWIDIYEASTDKYITTIPEWCSLKDIKC